MSFTPLPFNQIPTVTSVPAGSQIICVVGGNLRRADFSLLPKGDPGDEGPQGPAGSSINLLGTLDNEGQLPTSPTPINGDAYFIGTNLWVYTVDEWVDTGSFQGEPGTPVEFQTADGFLQYRVVGDANWINLVSITEFQGNSISAASGVPNNANGNESDLYINVTNGDLYQKSAGVWGVIGNLTGPPGNDSTGGIGFGDTITIMTDIENNLVTLNLDEAQVDIEQFEKRFLGRYILRPAFYGSTPIELIINLNRNGGVSVNPNSYGTVWFEVEMPVPTYDVNFNSTNKLVRITITNDEVDNGGGSSFLYEGNLELPIVPDGSTTSNGVPLEVGQEFRIDNTKLTSANSGNVRNSLNAFSTIRLLFYKPEGFPYFIVTSGEANISHISTFVDAVGGSDGSYYGY